MKVLVTDEHVPVSIIINGTRIKERLAKAIEDHIGDSVRLLSEQNVYNEGVYEIEFIRGSNNYTDIYWLIDIPVY